MEIVFSGLNLKKAALVVLGKNDHWMRSKNIRADFDASGVIE